MKKTPEKKIDEKEVAPDRRFPEMSDLISKYETDRKVREKSLADAKAIQSEYEQRSFMLNGEKKANFGQLRFKIVRVLTTYVDYIIERSKWAGITTWEGEGVMSYDWSENITAAFHKFCIKPWKDKAVELMLSIEDMLLAGKGPYYFKDPYCCYPTRVAPKDFIPDSEAKMKPDSFDICHIQIRETAVGLYRKLKSDEMGYWSKEAILSLLSHQESLRRETHDSLWQMLEGGSMSATESDRNYDLVMSFVKEYRENKNCISVYVFPASGAYPSNNERGKVSKEDASKSGYLYYAPNKYENMGQAVGVLAHTVSSGYYEEKSLASMLYPSAVAYNVAMNSMLEASIDSMRVYLRSDSPEAHKKLSSMKHGSFNILPPQVELQQDRIQRPIGDAMAAIRTLTTDTNAGVGHYQINESSVRGSAKTATQVNLDASESTSVATSSLKVFNSFMSDLMCEMFRRFTTKSDPGSEEGRYYKRFREFLTRKGVPDKAWKMENVSIESVPSVGAGSPSQKLQASNVIMQTLLQPVGSAGQLTAQRMAIAAVAGNDNVEAFIPPDQETAIPEDSRIGLENDALGQHDANPSNIMVLGTDMHLRHIPRHIADAEQSLQTAARLFQGIHQMQTPKDDIGVYILQVINTLTGVDNKLAHTMAHMEMASRTENKTIINLLPQFEEKIAMLNRAQDALEKVVNQVQEQRMSPEEGDEEAELSHKQKMFALQEEHTRTMLQLDLEKAVMKGDQLRENSNANARNKMSLETAKAYHEAQLKLIEAENKNRITNEQTSKKPASKAKGNTKA